MFQVIKVILLIQSVFGKSYHQFPSENVDHATVREDYGGDLPTATFDVINGFLFKHICICYDSYITQLLVKFAQNDISVLLFNISSVEMQDKYFKYLEEQVTSRLGVNTIFFSTHRFYEHVLLEVYSHDYIRRNTLYIFYWGRQQFSRYFLRNVGSVTKIFVITNPRNGTFRIFYNQALPYKTNHLEMINWWRDGVGLFNHPTLPTKYNNVFKNFKGKIFKVPVIHKPPWHFIEYQNDSIKVLGGRDDCILSLLGAKLNFRNILKRTFRHATATMCEKANFQRRYPVTMNIMEKGGVQDGQRQKAAVLSGSWCIAKAYQYFDPPERIQGSAPTENGTFKGVLGLIWQRKADFFIGDVALSHDRSNYVEFSFITLADSGAFITHAPSKLNEALALLRPFQWQVWPAIGVTFIIVGPVLYAIIALPNAWRPRFLIKSHIRLFCDCTWFTTTVLLKQTGKEPSSSHKARCFVIILSIAATYVINDMYSANLTSLLAKPGLEKAINNLNQLEKAMATKSYDLYVERHSSSYRLFENGSGIYSRLWKMMTRRQSHFLLESVEEGVKLVKDNTKIAVIAGRETLFFDIERFGVSNFHLSEKLNTAYSAIAFQLGCPYIEEINRILMAIFEAGIITKMTENEYEKLGKQKKISSLAANDIIAANSPKDNRRTTKVDEHNEKLQPISLNMLQGTFYLLGIGNLCSGLILMIEILVYKHRQKIGKTRRITNFSRLKNNWKQYVMYRARKFFNRIKLAYRRALNETLIMTLDYLD